MQIGPFVMMPDEWKSRLWSVFAGGFVGGFATIWVGALLVVGVRVLNGQIPVAKESQSLDGLLIALAITIAFGVFVGGVYAVQEWFRLRALEGVSADGIIESDADVRSTQARRLSPSLWRKIFRSTCMVEQEPNRIVVTSRRAWGWLSLVILWGMMGAGALVLWYYGFKSIFVEHDFLNGVGAMALAVATTAVTFALVVVRDRAILDFSTGEITSQDTWGKDRANAEVRRLEPGNMNVELREQTVTYGPIYLVFVTFEEQPDLEVARVQRVDDAIGLAEELSDALDGFAEREWKDW